MFKKIIMTWMLCLYAVFVFAQKPTLKLATVYHIAPYVMQTANNHDYGFDIDLMKYVCKKIDYQCQFIKMDFKSIMPALLNGDADIGIGSLAITSSRLKQVYFSAPYLPSRAKFLANQDTFEQHGQHPDIRAVRIGIIEDSILSEYLLKNGVSVNQIFQYGSEEELIQAMHENKVDFIFDDDPTINYWAAKHESFIIHGNSIPYGYGMGIAISPKRKDIIEKVNTAVNEFLNGPEFHQYYHIYFGIQNLS